LRDRAIALAPDPELRVAPSHIGLTGLDSFFWSGNRPQPIVATAAAGPVLVTAQANPLQFVWDFGDGYDSTSSSPGRPWTRHHDGSIAHMYETAGRYRLTAELIWAARWRIGAGPWRDLGSFTTLDSRRYPVREIVAWLVPPR
jgi:hypothetical protein